MHGGDVAHDGRDPEPDGPDVGQQSLGTPDPAPVDDEMPAMDGSGPQELDDDEL